MLSKCLGGILPGFLLLMSWAVANEGRPSITLYIPEACLACVDYAEYLRESGYPVTVLPQANMGAVKRRLKVPKALEAEPTGVVAGYFIEGHVSAEDIQTLLLEKPKALGLAVPGLPMGAPGVEYSTPICDTGCTVVDQDAGSKRIRREMYHTLLVKPKGDTAIFARH